MIEHPIHTQRALLAWQRPLGSGGRRNPHAVAKLVQAAGRFSFRYLDDEELEPARLAGFTFHPGLPFGSSELDSDAEEVLVRRLPPRNRLDVDESLQRFGLPPSRECPALTLLAYTGARPTGDSFSVCETFDRFEPPFSYVFDVAGGRHQENLYNQLIPGESLHFERKPGNQHDPNAVRITRNDGTTVGYVNHLQTGEVGRWMDDCRIAARVFRINVRIEYPRFFILADIAARTKAFAAWPSTVSC